MSQTQTPGIDFTSSVLLASLAIVWGGSFFFAEIALREVPPLTLALHRIVWAIPVLLLVLFWQGVSLPRSISTWLCYVVMGALNNAIPFALIFWGQVSIESGLAAILNATTAVFGAVVAGILLVDEPLTTRKITGALFGLFGVAVIMGIDALSHFSLRNLAQLAIIGAALSYAFAGVWGKRFLSGQSPIVNSFGMLLCSAILMLPVVLMVDGVPTFNLSTDAWSSLLALAVFSTAFAYLLYFSILARAGAANVTLVTLLIPPVTITLGVTFLGEQLGIQALIGFVFIAIGLTITDGRLWRYVFR